MAFTYDYNVSPRQGIIYSFMYTGYVLAYGLGIYYSWILIRSFIPINFIQIWSNFVITLLSHKLVTTIFWIIAGLTPIFMYLGTTQWKFSTVAVGSKKLSLGLWSFEFKKDGMVREPRVIVEEDAIKVYIGNSLEKEMTGISRVLSQTQIQQFKNAAIAAGYMPKQKKVGSQPQKPKQKTITHSPYESEHRQRPVVSNSREKIQTRSINRYISDKKCHFCQYQDFVSDGYCYRCLIPAVGSMRLVDFSPIDRRCECGEIMNESCAACGKRPSIADIPYLSDPRDSIHNNFSGGGYFDYNTNRQMSGTALKMGFPQMLEHAKRLGIDTTSEQTMIMSFVNIAYQPLEPGNGYAERKKFIDSNLDMLGGVFAASKAVHSPNWVQHLIRGAIYHRDLYSVYTPEVYNKIILYVERFRENIYEIDLKTVFNRIEQVDTTVDFQILLETISSLAYMFILIQAQFRVGHKRIGAEILDAIDIYLVKVHTMVIAALDERTDHSVFYQTYLNQITTDGELQVTDLLGTICHVMLICYKMYFEALAAHPFIVHDVTAMDTLVFTAFTRYSEFVERLSRKTDNSNNKWLSISGSAYVLATLTPWIWYYDKLAAYASSKPVISKVIFALSSLFGKVNPGRIWPMDATKLFEGLLLHDKNDRTWIEKFLDQFYTSITYKRLDPLDRNFNLLISQLTFIRTMMQAGLFNLVRSNLEKSLNLFHQFNRNEKNRILQLTELMQVFELFNNPIHLPIKFERGRGSASGYELMFEQRWLKFSSLMKICGKFIGVIPSLVEKLILGLLRDDQQVRVMFPNIQVINHMRITPHPDESINLSRVIFEIHDGGQTWREIPQDERISFYSKGQQGEFTVYILATGTQMISTIGSFLMSQVYSSPIEFTVIGIESSVQLSKEEVHDVVIQCLVTPQYFDKMIIHLLDSRTHLQEIYTSIREYKEYRFRTYSLSQILHQYIGQ